MESDPSGRDAARRPGAKAASKVIAAITLVGILSALGWVLWQARLGRQFDGRGGLSARLRVSRDIPSSGRSRNDPYVGSKACAECHPGEYALFTGSGHSQTFRAATDRPLTEKLAGQVVEDPELPGVRWSFARRNGEFEITRDADGDIRRFVVDYALGSGHHATTFVTVLKLDPPRILEHRLTYFTKERNLGITPGQQKGVRKPGTSAHGCEMAAQAAMKCLGCHSTELSGRDNSELDPVTMISSVSCERCHGAGRAHVEAARASRLEEDMLFSRDTAKWLTRTQLEFCGKCHRHPDRVPPEQLNPEDPELARFQPIGLSQSRCFKGSGGKISCLSCHDPHARTSSDPSGHEQVCLGCHGQSTPRSRASLDGDIVDVLGAPCPVSPTTGCLGCHMPKVSASLGIPFTDHWIRIRSRAERP